MLEISFVGYQIVNFLRQAAELLRYLFSITRRAQTPDVHILISDSPATFLWLTERLSMFGPLVRSNQHWQVWWGSCSSVHVKQPSLFFFIIIILILLRLKHSCRWLRTEDMKWRWCGCSFIFICMVFDPCGGSLLSLGDIHT